MLSYFLRKILCCCVLLLVVLQLKASLDSIPSIIELETLSTEQRWLVIKEKLDQASGDDQKALLNYLIKISEKEGWPSIQANTEKELGLFFYRRGGYANALTHYQKALTAYEGLADISNQGATYNLLATLSKKQKDYDRAHAYLDKTLALCTQIKDSSCISTVYDNRGLIYSEQQNFTKAKEHYLVTLDIRKRIRDTVGLGYVYSNLAEVAKSDGLFELAENYLFL